MRGRPSSYTEEIASEICRRLAKGESLRAICREDHMPDEATVREWAIDNREGFHPRYARAREVQAYAVADELIGIADDARNDWMEHHRGEAVGYVLNGEHVQRSRLRIDTRKWHLSKILPKVYGDKTEVAVTGANGGPWPSMVNLDPVEASRAYQRMISEVK
jgi:hypothetical protein